MTTAADREVLRQRVAALARPQAGVVSRQQLRELGITRPFVEAQLAAARWRQHGRHTLAVHTGPLDPAALRWRAVWEVDQSATVDGVSALQLAGLTGFDTETVHVSLSGGRRAGTAFGVSRHYIHHRGTAELIPAAPYRPPCTTPAVAALRAASWAVSDRQAALLLVLPVQQRIVRPQELRSTAGWLPMKRRRGMVRTLIDDIADGAHSLGELDFARMCRRYGLPEPSRQVVRQTPGGRIYLDVRWDHLRLVVEVDGIHHELGLAPVHDALRQNEVSLRRDTVLRIPLLALRICPDDFMRQVQRAHHELTTRHAIPA